MEESNHGMPKHGEFCWTEIICNDARAGMEFYGNVFGWEFQKSTAVEEEMGYFEFNVPGGYPMGAVFKMTPEMCGDGEIPPPHFMNYVAVDDVDATAARAAELGGTVVSPPTDIPNVGRFAMIQDPAGAMLAVIRLAGGAQ